jgi:hypothetical protein
MTHKTHDACVKTGTYESNGETKGRYLNVGALMQGDKGPFLLMERTFNPAGVLNDDGRSTVLISFFEVDDQRGQQDPQPEPRQQQSRPTHGQRPGGPGNRERY